MSKKVEEWRSVVGYDGLYEVSDWGNVDSLNYNKTKRRKRLSTAVVGGYIRVFLSKNGKTKMFSVHKLVAEAFLPIPERLKHLIGTRKLVVGHIKPTEEGKEDKTANEAWNIRWMSQEENNSFGTRLERVASKTRNNETWSKKVRQLTLDGELVKIWSSIGECHRNGFKRFGVYCSCNGGHINNKNGKWINSYHYKGYKWEFVD